MAARSSSPILPSFQELRGISYEDAVPGKPPIPITVATPPQKPNAHKGIAGFRRNLATRQFSPNASRSKLQDDRRRDSGLAASNSTARDSRTTLGTEIESVGTPSIRQEPRSVPVVAQRDDNSTSSSAKPISTGGTQLEPPSQPVEKLDQESNVTSPRQLFLAMLPEIPTSSFEDLTLPGKLEFSKRGSMLIGGRKANNSNGSPAVSNGRVIGSRKQPAKRQSLLAPAPAVPLRVLSADDEALSQKVRSMYQDGGPEATRVARMREVVNDGIQDEDMESVDATEKSLVLNGEVHPAVRDTPDSPLLQAKPESTDQRINSLLREPGELAGGIEDWEDLNGDVDRYGFIVPRKLSSQTSSLNSARASPDTTRLQRVSTLLQLVSESPRQSRSPLGNMHSARSPARSARSTDGTSTNRAASTLFRPTSSQSFYRSTANQSRLRNATNRLPYNKDRRCVDEAGDMLTLPPGLAEIAEDQEDGQIANDLKRREWEREEKWRKMGKVVKRDKHGGGMVFEFDTKSPKVIERTWKGIPDRWRATAWHGFLTASAKKRKGMNSDDELTAIFKALLDRGSPDDMQIDIDVPRTINSHIMFRRRYRGGQRLLFRVLHCMSIYFPDTGYVQGMAALAATLLCYYDEEMTFVMMVRLWQLRGLDRLYKPGFEGLMQALEEFEGQWLGKGEVAAKLVSLSPNHYHTSTGLHADNS